MRRARTQLQPTLPRAPAHPPTLPLHNVHGWAAVGQQHSQRGQPAGVHQPALVVQHVHIHTQVPRAPEARRDWGGAVGTRLYERTPSSAVAGCCPRPPARTPTCRAARRGPPGPQRATRAAPARSGVRSRWPRRGGSLEGVGAVVVASGWGDGGRWVGRGQGERAAASVARTPTRLECGAGHGRVFNVEAQAALARAVRVGGLQRGRDDRQDARAPHHHGARGVVQRKVKGCGAQVAQRAAVQALALLGRLCARVGGGRASRRRQRQSCALPLRPPPPVSPLCACLCPSRCTPPRLARAWRMKARSLLDSSSASVCRCSAIAWEVSGSRGGCRRGARRVARCQSHPDVHVGCAPRPAPACYKWGRDGRVRWVCRWGGRAPALLRKPRA